MQDNSQYKFHKPICDMPKTENWAGLYGSWRYFFKRWFVPRGYIWVPVAQLEQSWVVVILLLIHCVILSNTFSFLFSLNHAVEITFQQNVLGVIWIITLSPGEMIKCICKISKQCGKDCVYYDLSVWFYKCEFAKSGIIHCGLTIDAQVLCKHEKKR